jgi:zinc protease
MTLDDPDRIVSRALFSTAYRTHPFQYPVIGHRSLFEHVTRDGLAEYYKSRYQPNNMVLSIVGDFDPDSLRDKINATFGKFPRGNLKPVVVPVENDQLAIRESRLFGNYNMARGLMAYKVPGLRHDDSPALDVMAAIIGSGHSGRLRQKLREDLGLVHYINASMWNPANPGLLFIQYQTDAEKALQAEEEIIAYCQSLGGGGFTEEEVEKARRFAFVSEIHSRQTASGLASRLGLMTALVGDLNYPKRYFGRIQSLTADAIRELAQRTFDTSQLNVSTLLPEAYRSSSAGKRTADTLPPFEERTLSNGARLIWQQDKRLPRTWIRFSGLGGPLLESSGHNGATSLMATLLARDTEFNTASEVADKLESGGGFMMDASGNNTYALSLELMPEELPKGIQLLEEALFHPAFKEETLIREREAQIAHIQDMEDEILDFGRLALRKHFFGDHPFAYHPCGTVESAGNLDEQAIRRLHKELLVGSNAVVVITGDFDKDAVLPQLESLLEKIPSGNFELPKATCNLPATTQQVDEKLDREQAVVLEAYPDVGIHSDDTHAAELLDEILSDMAGPLFKAVREDRSLAYFVGASRLLGYDFGCFCLYAGTHPDSTGDVYACFDQELQRIRDGGLSKEELEAARTRLIVHSRFSLQSPSTRATKASLNALYGKPIMDWLTYEERLMKLTAEDLTAFANKFLCPDKRLRVSVTPN